MSYDDDSNPFAAAQIRQPTAPTFPNPQTSNNNNQFTNTTTPPVSPSHQPNAAAAYLTPSQPSTFQPPAYTPAPTPFVGQQPKDPYIQEIKPTSTSVDFSKQDQRQADLEEREKRIAERERVLANGAAAHDNNFPPLPKQCPCQPCFYQDINLEITMEFQPSVKYVYYLWLFYSLTLCVNMIAALSYFIIVGGSSGGSKFGLSLVYLILFIPTTYICWFRPIYRAFKSDSSFFFMIFFVIDLMFIGSTILFAIGVIDGMCGFAQISIMSKSVIVGFMMIVTGGLWSLISIAAIILTIRVHRLYRQSGASIEQAQKEFQTAFINNETVRGAARGVATAGINEALRSDDQHTSY